MQTITTPARLRRTQGLDEMSRKPDHLVMGQFAKYFTPEEASRTLPLVKGIVTDILATSSAIREEQAASASEIRLHELTEKLKVLLEELEGLGCSFKDWGFDVGLVDFPALIDNREVFLCWRSDEERLTWYHDIYEGYAGRKPIPPDYLP